MSEIKEKEVYTLEEAQDLLKVSRSTMMRQIKKGILRAGKFGGQYRILGAELLRLLLPRELTDKIEGKYDKFVDWIKEQNND
jgi:excisionase family DNA binding protein